jgi:hypothetical protein
VYKEYFKKYIERNDKKYIYKNTQKEIVASPHCALTKRARLLGREIF